MIKRLVFGSLSFAVALIAVATPAVADYLVADYGGNQVLRYSRATDSYSVFISSADAGAAGLNGPVGMRLDAAGDLLITSQNNNSILKFDLMTGSFLSTFSASGPLPADLQFMSDGRLLVANLGGNTVDVFNADGSGQTAFTNGDPGLAGISSFAFDAGGDLFVGSFNNGDIFRFDGTTGAYTSTFATVGPGVSGLNFDADGDLWVSSLFTHTVFELDPTGAVKSSFSTGTAGTTGFDTFPGPMVFSPYESDELLISLTGLGGVYRFGLDGSARGIIGGTMTIPGQVLLLAIPEPSSAMIFAAGFAMLSTIRRRK